MNVENLDLYQSNKTLLKSRKEILFQLITFLLSKVSYTNYHINKKTNQWIAEELKSFDNNMTLHA